MDEEMWMFGRIFYEWMIGWGKIEIK